MAETGHSDEIEAQNSTPAMVSPSPVSEGFGLSYASYLVFPRVLMEQMPFEWQTQFRRLWDEWSDTWQGERQLYAVTIRDAAGHFGNDPLGNYRYPDWAAIERARGTKEQEE